MKKEEQKITKEDRAKIDSLKGIIEEAEKSIYSARAMLLRMEGDSRPTSVKKTYGASPDGKIVEGVFDGQIMIGHDGKQYPVPANYASKSKLVEGDMLKLTITDDGNFVYKQIGPVERKRLIGMVREDESGNYVIEAEDKLYKVLLASVTYYKAQPGDEVTIIIPRSGEPVWSSIENVTKKATLGDVLTEEEIDPFIKADTSPTPSNGRSVERFVTFGEDPEEDSGDSQDSVAKEPSAIPPKKIKKIIVRKKPAPAKPTLILGAENTEAPEPPKATKVKVMVEDEEDSEEEIKGNIAEDKETAPTASLAKEAELASGKMKEIMQEWTPAMEDLEKEVEDAKASAKKAAAEEEVLDSPIEKESFGEKFKVTVKGEDAPADQGIVQKEFPDTPEEILKD